MTTDLDITQAALGTALAHRLLRRVDTELVTRGMQDLAVRASAKKELHANSRHAADAVLRAAKLQSVANWMQAQAEEALGNLEAELVALLRKEDPTQAGNVDRLFFEAQKLIEKTFGHMAIDFRQHFAQVAEGVAKDTRAKLAKHHNVGAGSKPLLNVHETPVLGATLDEHFEKLASDALFKFKATVRQGLAAEDTLERIVERVEGTAEPVKAADLSFAEKAAQDAEAKRLAIRVRLFDAVENSVNKVIENAIQAYAHEGASSGGEDLTEESRVTMGWQWVTMGDERVCDQCEFYSGNRWTADYEPVEDAPEYPDDPPLHFGCRCAVVPSDLSQPASDEDFGDYLAQFSRTEQEAAFGKSALRAYHRGEITSNQLIGQKSNLMTLEAFLGE